MTNVLARVREFRYDYLQNNKVHPTEISLTYDEGKQLLQLTDRDERIEQLLLEDDREKIIEVLNTGSIHGMKITIAQAQKNQR